MTISVLMSTYKREKPEYLDSALRSIWTDQTRRPDQIVLVADGPLTPQLDDIIDKWHTELGNVLTLVRKEKNEGLAAALNDGIKVSYGDYIARMDSDDISTPERFLQQEQYMNAHPEVDILGGALHEFNDQGTLDNIRSYPLSMDDVMRRMHRSTPLGHPCTMFRRRFFDAGHMFSTKYHICEDIALWFEAAHDNCIINNIPDVVLHFRRNDSMMNRRSHEKAWAEFKAYNHGIYMLYGLFTTRYAFSLMRLLFRLMPTPLVRSIYNSKIRKTVVKV